MYVYLCVYASYPTELCVLEKGKGEQASRRKAGMQFFSPFISAPIHHSPCILHTQLALLLLFPCFLSLGRRDINGCTNTRVVYAKFGCVLGHPMFDEANKMRKRLITKEPTHQGKGTNEKDRGSSKQWTGERRKI